jgi:curli biogenesis system outer membrane secretion channel CsgG
MTSKTALLAKTLMASAALLAAGQAYAQRQAKPSKAQQMQDAAVNDVPHCTRKLGTLSIVDGDDPRGWTQYQLAPPAKLLRVLVQRSGCFNIVDRGTGLQAAARERDIGGGLGMQRGSNVGQGQIKAADYVLIAEVAGANSNSSGSGMGGAIGGLLGGRTGAAIGGGIKSRKLEANTVLSLTNVRTTETISVQDGYAAKNDISFGAGGGLGFFGGAAGAVGGGYENTDIGKIVTLSFIQAYAKMVDELGLVRPGDAGTAQAAPMKTFTAQAPVAMRSAPAATGKIIRTIPVGAIVYPTGNKNGLWWEVADENDNVGWVLNTKLAPSN